MATNKSKLELGSGPMKHSVTHPPSFFVLVVGAREECDERVLKLCDDGFLTLHFDASHRHPAWHPAAGTYWPSDSEVATFEEEGQINPGTGYRDGERYFVDSGRGRLKKCAIINARRSETAGKHTESYLYLFTASPKGTTEADVFARSIGENFDRRDELPSHIGMLIRKAKTEFGWDKEKLIRKFHLSDTMQSIYLGVLDCAEDVRPLIDRGDIAVRAAGLLLSKVARKEQLPLVKEIWAAGIKRGAAFEEALRRRIEGKPIFDETNAPPVAAGSGTPPSSSGGEADTSSEETGDDSGGRAEADAKPHRQDKNTGAAARLRAPTRRTVETWVERLKPHATAPEAKLPKATPKEMRDAVNQAIDAAFFEGARLMAMRFQGKTPAGWGRLRDVLETEAES